MKTMFIQDLMNTVLFLNAFSAPFVETTFLRHKPGDTVILPCKCNCEPLHKRWRDNKTILTSGLTSSKQPNWAERLSIDIEQPTGHYNLKIVDLQLMDTGEYLCELIDENKIYRKIIVLLVSEYTTLGLGTLSSEDNRIKDTTAAQERAYSRNTKSNELDETTAIETDGIYDGTAKAKKIDTPNTTQVYVEKQDYSFNVSSYLLIIGGLLFVLLVSVGCNFVMNRYANRRSDVRILVRDLDNRNERESESIAQNNTYSAQSLQEGQYETIDEDSSSRQNVPNIPFGTLANPFLSNNQGSQSSSSVYSYIDPIETGNIGKENTRQVDSAEMKTLSKTFTISDHEQVELHKFICKPSNQYLSLKVLNTEPEQIYNIPKTCGFDIASSIIPTTRSSFP